MPKNILWVAILAYQGNSSKRKIVVWLVGYTWPLHIDMFLFSKIEWCGIHKGTSYSALLGHWHHHHHRHHHHHHCHHSPKYIPLYYPNFIELYPVVSNSYQHWCLHAPPALPLGRTGEAAAGVRWCRPPRAWAPDHPCATPNSGSIPPYSRACIGHRHGHMPHRHGPRSPKKQIHFIRWRQNKVHVGTCRGLETSVWIPAFSLNVCRGIRGILSSLLTLFLENRCGFQTARTLPWKKKNIF